MQGYGYKEALSDIICNGCGASAGYLSCRQICELRDISADKCDYGYNRTASDGHLVYEEIENAPLETFPSEHLSG